MSELEPEDRLFNLPSLAVFSTREAIAQYKENCFYIENNHTLPPRLEVEFLVKQNEHLLFGIADHVYKANGREKNVFCDMIYDHSFNDGTTTFQEVLAAKALLLLKGFYFGH